MKLEELRFAPAYARLPEAFYVRLFPAPLPDPKLVAASEGAAALAGLDASELQASEFLDVIAGWRGVAGMDPLAMVYAGHQFGFYVPRLGDGRALLLGETNGQEWHLKGAGPTPFARGGDGRCVLRSAIREFLASEAMAALGIPTTRALAVCASSEPVYREEEETAASLLRLAPSHVRIGTFEYFHHTGQPEAVRALADFAIASHFGGATHAQFFEQVVRRTAVLMAQWQAAGFAHGVMNTDNFSILGLTLDYGPFGFMEKYEPDWVCNHSDERGRYAFDRQPDVARWNLTRLAVALSTLITEDDAALALSDFWPLYESEYLARMREKLGLREGDRALVDDVLATARGQDYALFFRELGPHVTESLRARVAAEGIDPAERKRRMDAVNPRFVLRAHLAQRAIEKAQAGDFSEVHRLHAVLRRPFDEQPEAAEYARPRPSTERAIELSCSS